MTLRPWLRSLAVIVLQASVLPLVRPQSQTVISGTVSAPSGALLFGVPVTLTDPATNERRTTKTDGLGVFRFAAISPGHYSLEVTANGFTVLRQDVEVSLNQALTLKLVLRPVAVMADRPPGDRSRVPGSPVSGEASLPSTAVGARRMDEPATAAAPPPREASVALAGPPPPPPSMAVRTRSTAGDNPVPGELLPDKNYIDMKVFYATDRKTTNQSSPASFYGAERGPDDLFSVGTCHVSIPRDHRIGHLESPRLWKFEFRQNPNRDVVLLSVVPSAEADFYRDLLSSVQASEEKKAFVFIHGYDTSFEDAARRTAQLAYDLKFKGVPLFYSWPSKNEAFDYLADEATIDWVRPHVKEFLEQVAARSGADSIYLVAHSMGNRVLTRALSDIAVDAHEPRPNFKEVILAAPDVDAGEFRQLAKVFPTSARHVTLYASSNDQALRASKLLHDYARAGESGANLVVVPGVDTIDVSALDTGFLGHSYVADNDSVIADIFSLLSGLPASRRACLTSHPSASLAYWFYGPPGTGTCPVPLPAIPTTP